MVPGSFTKHTNKQVQPKWNKLLAWLLYPLRSVTEKLLWNSGLMLQKCHEKSQIGVKNSFWVAEKTLTWQIHHSDVVYSHETDECDWANWSQGSLKHKERMVSLELCGSWGRRNHLEHQKKKKISSIYTTDASLPKLSMCSNYTIEEISICISRLHHIPCFSFRGHGLRAQKQEVYDWDICRLFLGKQVFMATGVISSHGGLLR